MLTNKVDSHALRRCRGGGPPRATSPSLLRQRLRPSVACHVSRKSNARPQGAAADSKPPSRIVSKASSGSVVEEAGADADLGTASEASKCPFLASLPTPPVSGFPWYRRLDQLFNPKNFQELAIGSHPLVEVPSQLNFPELYMVNDGDMIKAVMNGEGDITQQGTLVTVRGGGLIGLNSLVMVQEPVHKYLRNLIMPAFTAEAIAALTPRMVNVIDKYLSRWAEAPGRVLAHEELRLLTFEFIIKVVLGRDYDDAELVRLSQLYKVWTGGLLGWPFIDLPFTPYGRGLKAKKELISHFQSLIDDAREQLAAGRPVQGVIGNLVAAVDEQGNRLSDDQINDNLLLVLLAGHDTSSTTLTHVMTKLQQHPQVLEKLREEQRRLIEKYGPEFKAAVLNKMSYADAVIRETLRMQPVVSGLTRAAKKDFELGGYRVPEGTRLYTSFLHVSKNDPRWKDFTGDLDPMVFNPERMMTPEGQKQGWQMPFGYGPRFCVGYSLAMAEMKVYLALLARGYDFEADTNTEWKQGIGTYPANGLPTKVWRREL